MSIDDTSSTSSQDVSEIILPSSFVPGPHHVVCARGKAFWDHEGNQRYRAIVAAATPKYAQSNSKLDKSLIVSEIIQSLQLASGQHDCCFVKKKLKGTWVQCSEHFAREKVSQSLRDGLEGQYRSSTKAKKRRRTKASESINERVERVIHSNVLVSRQIDILSCDLEREGAQASDYSLCMMLSRANSNILETIKRDSSLLTQFQEATYEVAAASQ
jgi:hypothetical protein